MNTRIYNLLISTITDTLSLPKYETVIAELSPSTVFLEIPWTPGKLTKFTTLISSELQLENINYNGTIEAIVYRLNDQYMYRFFGEIWKPKIDSYQYSGWRVVDEINRQDPKAVLDFGCGYNPFKGRIKNLIGIDPFNNCADYMVDILDFNVEPESFDHIIAFGSLNFNSRDEIDVRFKKLTELLMPNGKLYFRANPGILWPDGPYVDIFPWTFEIAYDLANKHNLRLETFKTDNDRYYFVYKKELVADLNE
jgi:SAM-dependent methyltransferase